VFRRLVSTIVLAALSSAAFATGPVTANAQTIATTPEPTTMAELLAAVNREGGELDVSWSQSVYGGAAGARRFQDAINQKYKAGLKINYTPLAMPGIPYENQVVEEVRAGQRSSTDLLFGVNTLHLAEGLRTADYRPFQPDVPGSALYYDNRTVAVVTIVSGFIYNTKLIPPEKVPTSFADVLKPEWKGRIATPPYEGTSAAFLGLPQALGHDGMIRFFTAFAKQLGGVTGCGQSQRVASSEFLIFGIDCGDQESRLFARRGLPLGEIYPKEAVGLTYYGVGIPKTAAHPYAALLLASFMVTPEGQALLWDVMGADNWKLPGSRIAPILDGLRAKGANFVEFYALDEKHSELSDYAREINALINAPR
jgi:ABC-type thiamine transport system substrate-binding protein